MKIKYIYCKKCGVEIGEYRFSHIDDKLKSFGIDGGKVYKPYYYKNYSDIDICKDCKVK